MRGRCATSLLATVALGGASASACALIDRFPDVSPDPQVSTDAGGAHASSGTSAGEGGGGGEPVMCSPAEIVPCYSGPPGTRDQGICAGGQKTCNPDGMSFGLCVGEVAPTIESCASPEDENCDGVGCVGETRGALAFGDGAPQAGKAVAAFSNLVAITGRASGQISFGGDTSPELGDPAIPDGFLARFDTSLSPLWSRRFSDSSGNGVAFAPKSGEVVIAGGARGSVDFGGGELPSANPAQEDVFVARFKPGGAHLSSARYGDSAANQIATAVAVLDGGDAVITGSLAGSLDCRNGSTLVSAGGADVFVARVDPGSKMLWCKRFGDAADQEATAVAVAPGGEIVVVGSFAGTIDFGDGQHSAGGQTSLFFVARFKPTGEIVWSQAFGNKGYVRATGVAVDASGDAIVTGLFSGQLKLGNQKHQTGGGDEDAFVVKLDGGGSPRWSVSLGDGANQQGLSIAVDAAGNAIVTGTFGGQIDLGPGGKVTAAGGRNLFAVKLDPDGAGIWARGFGGGADPISAAVAADPLGAAWLTGGFAGSVDFGTGAVASAGATDAFLVKLTP